MRRAFSTLALTGLLSLIFGCGTMLNLGGSGGPGLISIPSRPPFPFGGVVNDGVGVAVIAAEGTAELGKGKVLDSTGAFLGSTILLVDMPVSLAGDVLTLPWTTFVFLSERQHPTGRYSPPSTSDSSTEPPTNAVQTEQP